MPLSNSTGKKHLTLTALSARARPHGLASEAGAAAKNEADAAAATSQRRYERLVASIDGVVWEADAATLDVTFISDQAERLLGYSSSSWLEDRGFWLDHLHHDDRDRVTRHCRSAAESGKHFDLEYRMIAADGRVVWINDRIGVATESGQPPTLYGVMVDVSDRKRARQESRRFREANRELHDNADVVARERAEEAVREIEARYCQLVEMSPDAIVIHSEGKLVFVNSAAVALVRAKGPSDLLGRPVLDLLRADMRAEVGERISRIHEQRTPDPREQTFLRLDGTTVEVEVMGMPMTYQGKPAVQVVAHDTTSRRKATTALLASEERYRALVENISDVVYSLDRTGNVTYISPVIERISSYTPAEVLGANFARFVCGEDLPQLTAAFLQNLSGEPDKVEFRVIDKLGAVRWLHASTRPQFVDGEVVGVTGIFSEITEYKRAQVALQQSDERYTELFEKAYEIVYAHDLAGNVLSVNPAIEAATGYDREEILKMNLGQLLEPKCMRRFGRMLTDAPQGQALADLQEWTILAKDGHEVLMEIRPRATYRDGVLVGFQGIARDITAQRKAQEEVRLLNEELELRVQQRTVQLQTAYEELDAFSSSVAHDLRAPLRVIEGFSHVFLEEYGGELNAEGRHYIERVHATSTRMDQLIQDLLALARVSRIAMRRQRIDVSAMARSLATEFGRIHPDRAVEFVIADGMHGDADPVLLRLVLENLLGNACKYTSKHATARIEVGSVSESGGCSYFVRDDGAGFDMDHAAKLFGEFQRLHAVSDFEGTGIGLATVRRIVERHGGRVWAKGAVEGGATFSFTLGPAQAVASPQTSGAEGSAAAPALPAAVPSSNPVVEYRRRRR